MGAIQTSHLKTDSYIHHLGKWCGILLFSFMTLRQITYFPGTQLNLDLVRWTLITLLFLQFLAAYLFRQKAKLRAQSLLDVILPFTSAGLPFLVIMGPVWLSHFVKDQSHIILWNKLHFLFFEPNPIYGFSIMAFGEVITIIGMITLNRSFSIATEVRDLKTNGPYKWVRHPLYTGEIISLIGWTVYWCSSWTAFGTLSFIILQICRAKREEKKLTLIYPEYTEFKSRVGFLLPKLSSFKSK